jgi:hypothetical protein
MKNEEASGEGRRCAERMEGVVMHRSEEMYDGMPLSAIRKRREKLTLELDELDAVIARIESLGVPRDIDIGADFSGNDELIAEVIRKSPTEKPGVWCQIQTIYCSRDKCGRCPEP